MALIHGYEAWEPVDDARRRRDMITGTSISRRQYDKGVANGSIPHHPRGAFSLTKQNIKFSQSNTLHTIYRVPSGDLTSLWRVSTANSSAILPSNVSVAFRARVALTATHYDLDSVTQRAYVSTNFWNTRKAAFQEWMRLIEEIRRETVYKYFLDATFEEFEVVFRAG